MRAAIRIASVAALAAVGLRAAPAFAQSPTPVGVSTRGEDAAKPPLKKEEIAQVVAGIALYPDELLSQVLMASTYPLEIVEADRWVKKNTSLKGDALAEALEKQTWDASVKSLVNFPDVLAMMSEKLDWTVKLGDAFLGQQAAVMAEIQALRTKAKAQGNLKSDEHQKVTTEAGTPAEAAPGTTQVIVIEATNPSTVYVPTYDPTVVYGAWAYPAYAPYWGYAHPGWVAGAAALSFGVGIARGVAWGYAWGHSNWRGGNVDVNVNRNTNVNRNIDRSRHTSSSGRWQHNSSHRGGVPYRDRATSERYGRSNSSQAQSRESFRGRAEQGQRDIGSGRTSERGDRSRSTGRPSGSTASTGASNRGQERSRSSSSSGGAFNSVDRGGSSTRASSSRGQTSRASSGTSRSSGSRSSGGGRSRGGGGRR